MNKAQWLSIIVSGVLVLILFFAFDTKPKAQKELERSRVLMAESADIQVLLQEAKTQIAPEAQNEIAQLEAELQLALGDSNKIDAFKNLSGRWYALKQYAIAGHYAQKLAEKDQQGESWSIAGSTYFAGIGGAATEKERRFCAERAVLCFENAISLEPDNSNHQVNLALIYTEQPPSDNPMKGIQMLLKLNQDQPENVLVLATLGRLAIRTGQFDRAEERLTKAYRLQAENREVICLLAGLYEAKEDLDKAAEFRQKCGLANNNR